MYPQLPLSCPPLPREIPPLSFEFSVAASVHVFQLFSGAAEFMSPLSSRSDPDQASSLVQSQLRITPILLTQKSSTASNESILFDDDDFDLLNADVNCGIKDGVSFIDFSACVQELANKSMEYALVLKLLGRRVGFYTLYNRLLHLWKPGKQIRLTDIENDYYIVKFSSQSDYLAALTDGPWTIFDHYITVEPWSPNFDPLQAYPKRILAWIRLPDNGCRGRFARMAVKINLNQPLVSKIVVNGKTQLVVYESLPMCLRHTQNTNPPATTVSSPAPSPIQLPTESYGPWMLVEKRRNRTTRANNTSRPTDAPLVSHSRFNPLFSGNDHGHTFDIPVTADSVEVPAEHSEPSGGVTAPFIEPAAESVLETLTDTPTSVHDLVFVPSVLNPEKHTALTLDPAAPPISAARNVQQSARLNVEPSSVNVDTVHAGSATANAIHPGRSAMSE
ncbi:hypothetical protein V6N11_048043 [Hibiscus sabdariffa]|uniref:DUF4283 domain-containing protein n=1 Tax=Hibiscus sabdariffa TaxID=183260 RepID=A0ABR2NXT3_9ROSI